MTDIRTRTTQVALILALHCLAAVTGFKVYVYDLPSHFKSYGGFSAQFVTRLKNSSYYTTNGNEADYYWIPTSLYPSQNDVVGMFGYIKSTYPYWNQAHNRHVIIMPCDHGPGDCTYSRPIKRNSPEVPSDINPASPTRNVIHVMWNGQRCGADNNETMCLVCFQQGGLSMHPTSNSCMHDGFMGHVVRA